MPRSILSDRTAENNNDFRCTVKDKANRKGVTMKSVAPRLGMSGGSLYHRINNPDNFKVGELRKLFKALNFSEDEKIEFAKKML